jgi:hypothetical protein
MKSKLAITVLIICQILFVCVAAKMRFNKNLQEGEGISRLAVELVDRHGEVNLLWEMLKTSEGNIFELNAFHYNNQFIKGPAYSNGKIWFSIVIAIFYCCRQY